MNLTGYQERSWDASTTEIFGEILLTRMDCLFMLSTSQLHYRKGEPNFLVCIAFDAEFQWVLVSDVFWSWITYRIVAIGMQRRPWSLFELMWWIIPNHITFSFTILFISSRVLGPALGNWLPWMFHWNSFCSYLQHLWVSYIFDTEIHRNPFCGLSAKSFILLCFWGLCYGLIGINKAHFAVL